MLENTPLSAYCNFHLNSESILEGNNDSSALRLGHDHQLFTKYHNDYNVCNLVNAKCVLESCVEECVCVQNKGHISQPLHPGGGQPWCQAETRHRASTTRPRLMCFTGKVESQKPFLVDDKYPCYTQIELYVEFLNLLRGRLKADAYKYLVENSNHQITIDAGPPNADYTYSQKDLMEMNKFVRAGLSESSIQEILDGLNDIDMNFIARDHDMSITTLEVSDKEFTTIKPEEAQPELDFIDLKMKAQMALKSFYNKAAKDVARFPGFVVENGTLSIWNFIADSGANVSLIAMKTFLNMGGQHHELVTVPEHCNIENTSQGLNEQDIIGLARLKLGTLINDQPCTIGTANFIVLKSDSFQEILLGTDFLSTIGFVLSYEFPIPVIKLNCFKESNRVIQGQFMVNHPLNLFVHNDKAIQLGEGRQEIELRVPITGDKFVVNCNHSSYNLHSDIRTQNISYIGQRRVKFDDFFVSLPFEIHCSSPVTLQPHSIRVSTVNSKLQLGHCKKVNSNIISISQDPSLLSNNGQLIEKEGNFIMGFPVQTENLDSMLDNGIDPEMFLGDQELNLDHLEPKVRKRINLIHNKYSSAFSTKQKPLGKFTGRVFSLPISENEGPHDKPIRHSPQTQEEILSLCDEFCRIGVLQESSAKSEYNHRVFLVGKHNSKDSKADLLQATRKSFSAKRLVNDLRPLNSLIKVSGSNPLPDPNSLLNSLHNKYIICADLKLAYYCLELDPASQEKQSFYVGGRTFKLKKAGMGYVLSSSWLDTALSQCFNKKDWQEFCISHPSLQKFNFSDLVFIFCDDIVIHTLVMEDTISVYEYVLKQLHNYGFKLEKKKLKIFAEECNILGQRVTCLASGSKVFGLMDHKRTEMKDWPKPNSRRALLSRLACISAQIRLLPGVKHILQFFYVFLRGESLKWCDVLDRYWQMLMLVVQLNYTLESVDDDKPLLLFSDSSLCSSAGYIGQLHNTDKGLEFRTCGVSGRVYSKEAKTQSSVMKELSSVVSLCKDFENAIRSNRKGTFIFSDCKSVLYCSRALNSNLTFSRAAVYLSSLPNLRYIHFPGLALRCADIFSRLFEKSFAEIEKFDKKQAQKIPVSIFNDGDNFSMDIIDQIAKALPNCTYKEISRVPRQKVNLADIECSLTNDPFENEFLKGILEGYSAITLSHPVWRLAKSDKKSKNPPTEREFNKFISSRNFEELRNSLLQMQDMGNTQDKIICNFNFDRLPKLLHSKYFIWLNLSGDKKVSIKGQLIHPKLAMVSVQFMEYFDSTQIQLQVFQNCLYSMNVEVTCCQIVKKTTFSNMDSVIYNWKIVGTDKGVPPSILLYLTFIDFNRKHSQVKNELPKIVTTLNASVPESEREYIQEDEIENFTHGFLSHFHNLENKVVDSVKFEEASKSLSQLYSRNFTSYSNILAESEDGEGEEDSPEDIDCDTLSDKEIRNLKFKRSLTAINQLLYVSHTLLKGQKATSKLFLEIQSSDHFIKKVKKGVENENFQYRKYYIANNGLVFEKKKINKFIFFAIMLPKWMVALLIRSLHTGNYHVRAHALYKLLVTCISCPGLLGIITSETNSCLNCIFGQTAIRKHIAGAARSERSNLIAASWYCDYLESLPQTAEGYTAIFLAVDLASSFVFAVPVRNLNMNTCNFCLRLLLSLFPRIQSVHTDGAQIFRQWSDILRSVGAEHFNSTSRSEQQGQVEVHVRELRGYLSKVLVNLDVKYRHRWSDILHLCVSTLNTQIVRSQVQPFTRAGIFYGGLGTQAIGSPISLKEVEKSIDLLNNHRDKLLVDKSKPPAKFSPGDIVVFRRKKLEINPDVTSGVRALLPPVLKVYKILQVTPLYCKVLSLNDNQTLRIAKDKLEALTVEEYLRLNPASVGISKFVENLATRGTREIPDFFDAEKIFGPSFKDVEAHIKSCKSKNCPLIKQAKVYSIPYSETDLSRSIFGLRPPTVEQPNHAELEVTPPAADIEEVQDGGIEQLYSDFVDDGDTIVDLADRSTPVSSSEIQNVSPRVTVSSPPANIDDSVDEIVDIPRRPKLKVTVVQDSDVSDEIKDVGQRVTRFQPPRDLATRKQRKARGPPQNLAKRKGTVNFTLWKCHRNYFYEKFEIMTPLRVWEVRDALKSLNPNKAILKTKKKTGKNKNQVRFTSELYLLKFYDVFGNDSQVVVIKRSDQTN